MDSLEPWQAERIMERLQPSLAYLNRLRRRMERRGFPPNGRLYRMVSEAQEAVNDLYVELHYCSCDSGIGRERQ
jgi:hypothetical protein